MSTYSDVTQQIGDQWIAALERAGDAVKTVSSGVGNLMSKVDLPDLSKLPLPEQLTEASEAIGAAIPEPAEVVTANFALAERLLAAQRDLALRLLEAATNLYTPRSQRQS
jgi:hypothetical protein